MNLEQDSNFIEASASSKCNKEIIVKQIENIHQEDLPYVEKDLSFYEKVSLAFLLFGNTKANTLFILQKLLALYKNQNLISDILLNFSIENKNDWKFCLVEALAIIKAHRVLRKLGINKYEYEVTFLPYNPETSLYIHPVLKALYFLCEDLHLSETKDLIIETRNEILENHFSFSDSRFLEIFLLEWTTSSIITVGAWPERSEINKANLKGILTFLKKHEKDNLKRMIESVSKYVNDSIEKKEIDSFKIRMEKLSLETKIIPSSSGIKSFNIETDNFVENDAYKIEKETAGFVLIINQHTFYEETDPSLKHLLPKHQFKERKGTEKDKSVLKATFEKFGYSSYVKDNLTHSEIIATIRKFAAISATYDSLIICILSHGLEGVVYGSNSIPVQISEINSILASSKELYRKPKIVIIQACQGTKLQEGNTLELDSPVRDFERYSVNKIDQNTFEIITDKINFRDILTIFSTVRGYASFRDMISGSWFIQSLCKKINLFGNKKHLLDIITTVIYDVSEKRSDENLFMVPQSHSTLGKKFWFPKIQ